MMISGVLENDLWGSEVEVSHYIMEGIYINYACAVIIFASMHY